MIYVSTKADLGTCENIAGAIQISTKDMSGINELKQEIKNKISAFNALETEFITNQRQQECLKKSLENINRALEAVKVEELQDLISIDIKTALLVLGEITGEVVTDELLNNIFESFCPQRQMGLARLNRTLTSYSPCHSPPSYTQQSTTNTQRQLPLRCI